MLNVDLKNFKKNHKKNINQIIYCCTKTKGLKEINNLINNFLNDKNSFVFESVEKGVIKGRYTKTSSQNILEKQECVHYADDALVGILFGFLIQFDSCTQSLPSRTGVTIL